VQTAARILTYLQKSAAIAVNGQFAASSKPKNDAVTMRKYLDGRPRLTVDLGADSTEAKLDSV
jgi:hypothetical protein